MFKQSPSRNQRSKGFKIKHALQIALLLAVCIWLIYQVKHSHDKKKAFEESATKLSENIESQHDIVKFGRKDLNPRVERTESENERHGEEEETQEEEEVEEEIKHDEEEEQQEEENKLEESEIEGRGDGDDEIDEHEQERKEEEAKREEEFVDEEERDKHDNENEENEIEETQSKGNEEKEAEEESKENEEKVDEEESKESEEKVDEEEVKESTESAEKENEEEAKENEEETKKREDQIEEQDHDRNTQEAREEQYKGDDVSSAVFRDTQTVSTEVESGVTGNSNEKEHVEKLQVNELGMENKTNNLDDVTSEQKDADLKAGNGETTTESNSTVSATGSNSTSAVNATVLQEKGIEDNMSELENGSLPILTTKESIDLQEVNNSSTSENVGTQNASLQNVTDITADQTVETTSSNEGGDLDHKPVFLDQTGNSNMTAGMSRSDSNSSLSTTAQNEDTSKKESEESSSNTVVLEEQNTREEDMSESSTKNENNGDGDQIEISETTTEEEVNSSSSTTNDNEDLIDSNSTEDGREAQTDLGTLPEIETEGNDSEDVAAER